MENGEPHGAGQLTSSDTRATDTGGAELPSGGASNPGMINLDYQFYLQSDTRKYMFRLAGVVAMSVTLVLGVAGHWAWMLVSAAILVYFGILRWWVHLKFREGNLNAGCVVSVQPTLVAVFADLGLDKPSPAVKVVRASLNRMTGGKPELGEHVATVATYRGPRGVERPDAWLGYHPEVINVGTRDVLTIQTTLNRIPHAEWDALDRALTLIPKPYRPGLYAVSIDDMYPGGSDSRPFDSRTTLP